MSREERNLSVLRACDGRVPNARGHIRANCPFCIDRVGKEDRRWCLRLTVASGWWSCYRCEARGRLVGEEYEEDLSQFGFGPQTKEEFEELEYPEGFTFLYEGPDVRSIACEVPRNYLRSRGIGDQVGRDARIGASFEGVYRHRVIVPIYTLSGKLRGWSARTWGRKEPKYLYPEAFERASCVYGEAALSVVSDSPVIVTEGVFDAIAFWPDGVAVLGNVSGEQKEKLAASKRPIVVALDGDAWRKGEALAWELCLDGVLAVSLRLPPTKDPDELSSWVRAEGSKALQERAEEVAA